MHKSSDENIITLHNNSDIHANRFAEFQDENYDRDKHRHPIILDDSDSEEEEDKKDRYPTLLDVSDSEDSDAKNIRLLLEDGNYSDLSTDSTPA